MTLFRLLIIPICCVLLLAGCESRKADQPSTADKAASGQPPQEAQAKTGDLPASPPVLSAPAQIQTFELASQAIPAWRFFAKEKPVLVLLSDDPFMAPIPAELHTEVANLLSQGSVEEFNSKGKQQVANPILLPSQTVRAVLDAGFFSRLVWILPVNVKQESDLSLDAFRQQVVAAGLLSQDEADEMTLAKGIFSGLMHGIPFQAAPLEALPDIPETALLHLDLSYFVALHNNEIKTPLYGILHKTLSLLRQGGWRVAAATLSISTEEGLVPLEARFLAGAVAEVFNDPDLLSKEMPDLWSLRQDALFQETFFQPEEVLKIYQQMEKKAPKDASVKFDLYRTFKMFKDFDESMKALDAAIALDPGYARECVTLGLEAAGKQRPDIAVELFRKAAKAFPDNPFIQIQLAEFLVRNGEEAEAKKAIKNIEKTAWSPIYYRDVTERINKLSAGLPN